MHLIVTDSFVNFCSTLKLILDPPLKIIENNTMCSVQEHLRWFSCLAKVILAIFTWPVFSVHSSTNLSTNFFLRLPFSLSKYSPISHNLSHSLPQLLGFQINPLSHTPLSTNSLHSHLHLSFFHLCLLWQTLASNLHLHLQVSCHFMCLVPWH